MSPRPLWRWWLFCLALRIYFAAPLGSWRKEFALNLIGWCPAGEWFGSPEELAAMARGEVGDAF